jgi:hypothetical protein
MLALLPRLGECLLPERNPRHLWTTLAILLACRPRTAAAGGRPQAGLVVVEKLLTSTIYEANKTAWVRSSRHAMVAPWTWRRGQRRRLNG